MVGNRKRRGGPSRSVAVPPDLSAGPVAELWNEELPEAARALLTSAVLCFSRKGFHATTTRDITAAIGLSPGALYVHFPSKEEVLFEIVRTGHERALGAIESQHDDGDTRAYVGRLVAGLVAWHARHHTAARVCQYELAGLTPERRAAVEELRRRFTAVLRSAVTRGTREGVFDVPDVNRSVRAIVSLGIDLVRWYSTEGDDSPELLADYYADLALRMLGASASTQARR